MMNRTNDGLNYETKRLSRLKCFCLIINIVITSIDIEIKKLLVSIILIFP